MSVINYSDGRTLTTADETGLEEGEFFRLIQQAITFRAISFYKAAGFIPSVTGVTADGRTTNARVADVVRLPFAVGVRVQNIANPEWGTWMVTSYDTETGYVIRGRSGSTVLFVGEAHFWEVVR